MQEMERPAAGGGPLDAGGSDWSINLSGLCLSSLG